MTADKSGNSPQLANDPASPSLLIWTIGAVLGSSLGGGAFGLCLGAALGVFSPGYYRSVFPNGNTPDFDPVAVGIGQGLTQGVVFGTIVGLFLVVMFYRFRFRSKAQT